MEAGSARVLGGWRFGEGGFDFAVAGVAGHAVGHLFGEAVEFLAAAGADTGEGARRTWGRTTR